MPDVGEIGRWITEHEALLSGLAALVVLAGVVLSPVGHGLRRLRGKERAAPSPAARPIPAAASNADSAAASPATAAPAISDRTRTDPVVAVLPFDNLSSDPELQFFSDGVSEEIIQRLARGARLAVIGRASSFQFRGERKAEAVRVLDCTHVLDGSIRRAESRIRVSAQLVDTTSSTTLWTERCDRGLEDIFAVQDEIAEHIAAALDRAFARFSSRAVDPAVYDLYLRALPSAYSPEELRTGIGLLEVATQRAPHFAEAWGRLACLRAWLGFYLPFAERPALAARVEAEAGSALALDPQHHDALVAQLFVIPAYGDFIAMGAALDRLRAAPDAGHGRSYIAWFLRSLGLMRESLAEAERAWQLDALEPMSANGMALALMAVGRYDEAVPVYEALLARVPDMSFAMASLLRAHAFRGDWDAVDRLLVLIGQRKLQGLEDGIAFVRAKRDPTPATLAAWSATLEARVQRTGCVDVARLVYAAHLGLTDLAYTLAERGHLGPAGSEDDILGPDGYRTALLFQTGMPELRNDPRFARLCARLGLVEFWIASGKWPDCADELPYDFRAACAQVSGVQKDAFLRGTAIPAH